MSFLDDAKRRAASLRRDRPADESSSAPTSHRVEPALDARLAAAAPEPDPEIGRMARAFDALYSPPPPPTDAPSAGRTDNDNFFGDVTHDVDTATAPGDAALLHFKPSDAHRKTTDSARTGLAETSPNRSEKKTSIEMAMEMRGAQEIRESRVAPRAALQAAPEPPRPALAPAGRAREHREAQDIEPEASVPSRPRRQEWSSKHRRVHITALAGAAVALLIGAGLGYVAGKQEPTFARPSVESVEGGMKLRLDPDLRQP